MKFTFEVFLAELSKSNISGLARAKVSSLGKMVLND